MTDAIRLIQYAWRTNRAGVAVIGEIAPMRFFFARNMLVAFQYTIASGPGTTQDELYILANEDISPDKRRRLVKSIETIDNTYIVSTAEFEEHLAVLLTKAGIGLAAVPPTLTGAVTSTDGTEIVLEFSKALIEPADTGEPFAVVINGGAAVTPTAVEFADAPTNKKLELTLPPGSAVEYGDTVTIAYTRGSILAADGGTLISFTAQAVTNMLPAPPTLEDATTDATGAYIILGFSKKMGDPTGQAGEFAITVNAGTPVAPTAIAFNDGPANTEYKLTVPAGTTLDGDDVITVSYTAGTVLAADNGILASFADEAVVNVIT